MAFGKGRYVFLAAVIMFASAVSILSFSSAYGDPFELSVHLLALNGFLALSIATMMTPFLKEVTDFQNIVVNVVFNALFAGSIATFGLERMQQHKIRNVRKSPK